MWSTEVGDSVAVDEIIAQIETDKVCVGLSTCLCSAQILSHQMYTKLGNVLQRGFMVVCSHFRKNVA